MQEAFGRWEIQGQHLVLLPERAIFWEERGILLLADIHLGKTDHFRRHGIPVPGEIHHTDLARVGQLIQTWPVREIYCLGDLFHSSLNAGWAVFADWVLHTGLPFVLIQGNHDRLLPEKYLQAGVRVMSQAVLSPFFLVHDPADADQAPPHTYTLSGHLHPGVSLAGPGRQTLRLPCFWMGTSVGVLPAFGRFTGLAIQYPQAEDTVFVIADDRVIQLKRAL